MQPPEVIEYEKAAPISIEVLQPFGQSGSGGGTIPITNNLLKGDGAGNAANSNITSGNDIAMVDTVPSFVICTADGKRADSANVAHYGKISGITLVGVTSGFIANLIDFGEIVNGAWSWTAGQILFLNGQNISTTPPSTGFCQMVAIARNPTTIIMKIGVPILL